MVIRYLVSHFEIIRITDTATPTTAAYNNNKQIMIIIPQYKLLFLLFALHLIFVSFS